MTGQVSGVADVAPVLFRLALALHSPSLPSDTTNILRHSLSAVLLLPAPG